MWWVYIAKCGDDSYYVGLTDEVSRRYQEHRLGIGARYTKIRGIKEVVYKENFDSSIAAAKREKQLKKWSRAK